MVALQASVDPADFWHVAMAPGETKVLTLEQLDDLFRLDIIDAATRVWQPGMSEWLPLSVVAGLDAEPTKPRAPTPPPAPSRAPARPASPPQRPAATASFGAAPARPMSPQVAPAAPSARPVSFQPAPTPAAARPVSLQPAAATVALPWSTAPGPVASVPATPESFRPMVVSGRPMPAPTGTGAGGRWVLSLAFIVGVGVTLYRNDVLRQAAISAGQEAAFMKVESALGGPGFGTPRATQALTLATPTSLNAAVEAASTTAPRGTSPSSATPGSGSTSTSAAPTPERAADKPASAAPAAVSLSSLVAAELGTKKAKPERAERAAPARRGSGSASSAAAPSLGIKGSSHGDDPLNGKL